MREDFTIMEVSWQTHERQLRFIREQVFILEQQVPVEMEWDSQDVAAQHLLALNATGQAVGCARVLFDNSIGRMAVLAPWRGMGAGRACGRLQRQRLPGGSVSAAPASPQPSRGDRRRTSHPTSVEATGRHLSTPG